MPVPETRATLAQWSDQLEARSLTPAARPVKREPFARTACRPCRRRSRRRCAGVIRQHAVHASRIEPIRKTRVAEEIADRIRVLILDGTFPAGPAAARRTPARRTVRRQPRIDPRRVPDAGDDRAARHAARQGTFPQELDVDRLVAPLASVLSYRHDLQDELLDVRRMFEPAVARVAATRVTDEDLADLQRILDAQRRKLKTGRSAIVEDTAFHAVLARATRNRVVVSIMATLNDLLVESRKLALKQKGRPEPIHAGTRSGRRGVAPARRRRRRGSDARAHRSDRRPPSARDHRLAHG